jgi:hypothetical protein
MTCLVLVFFGVYTHHVLDDFDGAGWWMRSQKKIVEASIVHPAMTPDKQSPGPPTRGGNHNRLHHSRSSPDEAHGYRLPSTFIGSLNEDLRTNDVTRGVKATTQRMLRLKAGQGAPPTWYHGPARIGGFVWLQNTCLRQDASGLTFYSAGAIRRDHLGGGPWGPWKKKHSTYLEGLGNLSNAFQEKVGLLEARWHPEHAIFPWFRLRYSASNFYHAIDDVEPSVHFLGTVENHLSLCGATSLVLMRQGLDKMRDSLEMRLFKSATGTLRAYTIGQTKKNVVHCFRGAWMQVSVPGLKPFDPSVPYKIEVSSPISTINWRAHWRENLGLGTKSGTVWDHCAAPSKVPRITLIQRLHTRRIMNNEYIEVAMRTRGWDVNVVNLEGLPVEDQFAIMQNTTTLIAYHGAGLAWAKVLPKHAAEIQVIGLPCSLESHSRENFVPPDRYRIVHSSLDVVNTEVDENMTKRYCEVLRRSNQVGIKNMAGLTEEELEILKGGIKSTAGKAFTEDNCHFS